jgi:molecular chaperone HtpG
VSKATDSQTLGFQTEVRQLLHLMIHSLYSNKEIFLRELISNASDAADKLRFEAIAAPELLQDGDELRIHVTCDAKARTLTVSDNGIGMSREELIENLGTIARSGTSEFLARMTGDQQKDAQLIGQFGVGFYSAFIVADKVQVDTLRAGLKPEDAVRWVSDGQGEFTVSTGERGSRGTTVTLHLKKDEKEFCDAFRIDSLIRKYSDHIAFPVDLADAASPKEEPRRVNSATALWTRPRSEIDADEYREFYRHLSHDFNDPLAWSHNKVEGKREYTSLLFVPSRAPFDLWNRETPRGLKLYVQRVFIMDQADQFLPLYLRFIKGVVDANDLPLNVSRELLQKDARLTSLQTALTRRALDMLEKLARDEPQQYQEFWNEFGQVLKEGIVEDPANREKLAGLLRFATTTTESDAQEQSLPQYIERAGAAQDRIYYLVAENYETAKASPHLEQLRDKGIEVLLLSDRIDPWVMESLAEYDGRKFEDVSRGALKLPGQPEEAATAETSEALLQRIHEVLKDRVTGVVASRRLVSSPACLVAGEDDLTPQMRRLLEASGQALPESMPTLEINVKHPLLERLAGEANSDRFAALASILMDNAVLAEGGQLSNPAEYVQRLNQLILDLQPAAK